jgi:hypothetical protein
MMVIPNEHACTRDGLLYVETCLKKYSCSGFTSTMPEPLPLPEAVVEANNSSSSSSHQTPLRAIETEKGITDMKWFAEFIDNYKAEKKKMNWQVCFDIGRKAGFFSTYAKPQNYKKKITHLY